MIAGMAEGVELALGTMMFYGLADWVYKRAAASGVQPHHFLLLQAFFFAPGIFLYGLATGTLVLGVPFAWGMTAGVLVFVALYNFARSLASGAVSIVAPVFRLSFAITVAMGIVNLVYKLATIAGGSPATVLTGQASVFLPLTALFALARDRGFHPPPGAWRSEPRPRCCCCSGSSCCSRAWRAVRRACSCRSRN